MSDKVVAKIAAVADTKDTGITERLATDLWPMLGRTFPVIMTLRVSEHTEDEDGPKSLKLEIDSIEPTHEELATEHLRRLQRALYFARNPQPMLGDAEEPTVRDIVLGLHSVAFPPGTSVSFNGGPWIDTPGDSSSTTLPTSTSGTPPNDPLENPTQEIYAPGADVDALTEQGNKTLDLLAGGDEEPDAVGAATQTATTETTGDPA